MSLKGLFPRQNLLLTLSWQGETVRVCETAELGADRIVLGRAGADWELPAQDAQVSRRHAELFRKRGRWHLRDLGSRNGVWLFGERVEGGRPLAPGDVFLLGECRFSVALPPARARVAEVAPHHMLQRLGGKAAGERIALTAFPVRVGTGEGCSLRLSDALASRVHAELLEQTPEEGGAPGVFLRDLGSTNGTTVNGVPQKPEMNARLLSEGDTVAFASEAFRFLDRAVPHEDPKAGLRRGGLVAGLFALTVAVFAALRLFVWKDAATWLSQAEALGHACRFAEASEALEKARHARGAEGLAEALEVCAGRLDVWSRQARAWHAYGSAWASAAPGGVPHVAVGAPRQAPDDWPNALADARLAARELERLALAEATLRRLLARQTPFSEADLATLRGLPGVRVEVAALEKVGLRQGAAWLDAFRQSAQPASEAAAAALALRAAAPEALAGALADARRTEAVGGALAAEFARWRRVAAWVAASQRALPGLLGAALSGASAEPTPPPDVPEAQGAAYAAFREGQEARLRSARALGETLRPVLQAWTEAPGVAAEAQAQAAALARAWLAPGAAHAPRLAFLAAPEAEARRLLPAWQDRRARAKALLDAVEGIEGALAFIETQAPASEAARKVRQAAAFVAEAEALQGELLGQASRAARLAARGRVPETCAAPARAARRAE